MEDILYLNKENEEVFPRGSIIDGFMRQTNLGDIIAPTNPQRVAPVEVEGDCRPFTAPRLCTLCESGSLQTVNHVVSRYDGQKHKIFKNLNCSTQNVIYYIFAAVGTQRTMLEVQKI